MWYKTTHANIVKHIQLSCCSGALVYNFGQRTPRDQRTQRDTSIEICPKSAASSKPLLGRRSFKLWYNHTLKASLRRYSSLAISSATHPGISGMATWMMYFRRIAKCCKPPRPQEGQAQHTVTSRHNYILFSAVGFCVNRWVKKHFFWSFLQSHKTISRPCTLPLLLSD